VDSLKQGLHEFSELREFLDTSISFRRGAPCAVSGQASSLAVSDSNPRFSWISLGFRRELEQTDRRLGRYPKWKLRRGT